MPVKEMMSLKELFERVIRPEKTSDDWNNFVDDFINDIGLQDYDMVCDYHDKIAEHLKSCKLQTWICTDTEVGTFLHFFDDKPFAVTTQQGRKCDVYVYFVDKETYEQFTTLADSLRDREFNEPEFVNMDEMYPIYRTMDDQFVTSSKTAYVSVHNGHDNVIVGNVVEVLGPVYDETPNGKRYGYKKQVRDTVTNEVFEVDANLLKYQHNINLGDKND